MNEGVEGRKQGLSPSLSICACSRRSTILFSFSAQAALQTSSTSFLVGKGRILCERINSPRDTGLFVGEHVCLAVVGFCKMVK